MWLPDPIYKSLPVLYAAMGACFIVGVFYVGLDAPMSPVYLAMGLVSILASITVSVWRSKSHTKMQSTEGDDEQDS
ncbi:MAG: hypothetical protein ACR2QZ_16980 [Woeseiaceae bacterium]